MRIAIDAMGGDHAPAINVEGALAAAQQWQDMQLVLVGDQAVLEPMLPATSERITIHHASEVIAPEDEPVRAVRRKKDSSMVVAGRLLKEKKVDAIISAGNTGALMATGLLIVGRIAGIDRPGLAPMIPTLDGTGVLALDLGANMDATPEHLVQYGIMGSLYRSKVQNIQRPRVGLLNVGTEASKGNELTKAAFELLQEAPIHFVGNVEARDVMNGECDVLVCDGFVGNILLKTMEGTAGAVFTTLKQEFTRNVMSKLAAAILKPGLVQFKKKLDYTEHGGAPLLGIDGLVIKSHGSSDAKAIMNAVRQARIALQAELVSAISTEISRK